MSLDVAFLNFDHAYTQQTRLLNQVPHRWIDLDDLNEVNLYCSPKALQQIKKRLQSLPSQSITFIGSGNYHYVSYLLLEKIEEPFTLVLFDHHSDCQDSPALSCGSWVWHALNHLHLLKKVILIGTHPQEIRQVSLRQQTLDHQTPIRIMPYTTLEQSTFSWLDTVETEAVYISIDKDVLHPRWATTNWDHGEMSLDLLLSYLEKLAIEKRILGLDICGEWPCHPLGDRTDYEHLQKNEQANRAILSVVQECLHH